jgi:hypothetical protein
LKHSPAEKLFFAMLEEQGVITTYLNCERLL